MYCKAIRSISVALSLFATVAGAEVSTKPPTLAGQTITVGMDESYSTFFEATFSQDGWIILKSRRSGTNQEFEIGRFLIDLQNGNTYHATSPNGQTLEVDVISLSSTDRCFAAVAKIYDGRRLLRDLSFGNCYL